MKVARLFRPFAPGSEGTWRHRAPQADNPNWIGRQPSVNGRMPAPSSSCIPKLVPKRGRPVSTVIMSTMQVASVLLPQAGRRAASRFPIASTSGRLEETSEALCARARALGPSQDQLPPSPVPASACNGSRSRPASRNCRKSRSRLII